MDIHTKKLQIVQIEYLKTEPKIESSKVGDSKIEDSKNEDSEIE